MLMLPCEYCGRITPWPDDLFVPACCPECGWKPRALGAVWLAFSVGVFGLAVAMWWNL